VDPLAIYKRERVILADMLRFLFLGVPGYVYKYKDLIMIYIR
jgi:hypothetical protein